MDSRLLDILVCPATKGRLVLKNSVVAAGMTAGDSIDKPGGQTTETPDAVNKRAELWSRSAGLAYPIVDGIPRMVESEARQLSNEEIASLKDAR